mgnify:CR=1 FL=1
MPEDGSSRRRVLALGGTGLATLLSGCPGLFGNESTTSETPPPTPTPTETPTATPTDVPTPTPWATETETETPTETPTATETETPAFELHDVRLVGMSSSDVPTTASFNLFGGYRMVEEAATLVYEPLAKYHFERGAFVPYAATDWSVTESAMTITLRDDLRWHDGSAVTAGDLALQIRIGRTVGHDIWEYITGVSVLDERTVELTLAEPTHPKILEHTLLTDRLHAHPDRYERFLDVDANEIRDYVETDPIGNGPFQLVEANTRGFVFERFGDHPLAHRVTFTEYELQTLTDNSQVHRALLEGRVDVVNQVYTPPRVLANFPDHVREVQIPSKWGYGVMFNHDADYVDTREVRQAIAHVVDRELVRSNAGARTRTALDVPCGIATDDIGRWLGAEKSAYPDYGAGASQTDEAADVLESAGYRKSEGTWTDEHGDAISFDYLTPTGWGDWVPASETIVEQLDDFGFEVTIESVSSGDLFRRYMESDFSIGAFYWGPSGSEGGFPYFSTRFQIEVPFLDRAHNFPRGDRTVPARSGSGTMTIDPSAKLEELKTTTDPSTAETLVRDLAWHNAHDLPMLGITEQFEQSFVTTDDWEVPREGADAYGIRWPPAWLVRTGQLRAAPR